MAEGAFDRPFEKAARWLLDHGVKPNHFTFAQIPFFALEIWAVLTDQRALFVSLIVFVILLDGGDGILARVGGLQSRAGAILDASFDTAGIAIVAWGATQFFPEVTWWLVALFIGNGLLYLQNLRLNEKVISYLRGPILTGVSFPATMLVSLTIASIIVAWELLTRLPATLRQS